MRLSIRPACSCGALHRALEGSDSATLTYRRTCRRCGATWALVVHPLPPPAPGALAWRVEATCTKGVQEVDR